MADISDYLKKILSAVYGRDVRQAIRDAIYQCYKDGKAGAIDIVARERIDNIVAQSGSSDGNSELADIRVGANGKTYTTAGTAVREQFTEVTNKLEEMPENILNIHVWEKFSHSMTINLAESEEINIINWLADITGAYGNITIKYGDSVGMSNGNVTVAEPYSSVNYNSKNDSVSKLDVIKGKYAVIANVCYKIGDGATFTKIKDTSGTLASYIVKCSDAQKVESAEYAMSYGYVTSNNKGDYPATGQLGDYRYEYRCTVGEALSKIDEMKAQDFSKEIEQINHNKDDIQSLKDKALELDSTLTQKVEKEEGKGLSTEDYTTEEKEKLSGLENYNDAEIKNNISGLTNDVDELKGDLIEDTNKLWVDFPYTKGNYLTKYGGLSTMEASYVTDYIPVKSGQKIQVSGYAGENVALYAFYSDTQANTMISIYVPEVYGHYTKIVEVPEGANYIVACSFTDTDRFFIRIICGYDDLIEAIEKASNAELLLDYKPKYGHHLKKPFDFRNKTSVWFGDSITEGVTSPNLEVTNENYPTLFASYVGASAIYNKAVSGSCIADSNNQYSILNRILNYSDGAKDFTFVAGGTNDYTTGKQVGTFGDTTADTFYGALHLICEHLKTNDNFVNSTVIFITPINQNKNRDNPNAIESINAYRNAIYEVATSYDFNVVDGSQIGFPIERGGFADELCTDGVHPTQKGHEYYARALCGILM